MEPAEELHEMPPAEPQEMNVDEEEEEKCGPFLNVGRQTEGSSVDTFTKSQVHLASSDGVSFNLQECRLLRLEGENDGHMSAQIKVMSPFSASFPEFHLARECKDLEAPGEEPPDQLLTDIKQLEEIQNQQEMPGTSSEVQMPLSSGAHTQAPPDVKLFSSEQLGLCSAHRQQCNIHLEIQSGMVAQEGPRDGPGSSHGSGHDEHHLVSQEQDAHVHAMSNNSLTQAGTVSEPEADYFDQERQQCRLCKREFMYSLGLIEHGTTQVVSKFH
ncbi:hypothetical protein STEG23_013406 [Scotinomys teguina]